MGDGLEGVAQRSAAAPGGGVEPDAAVMASEAKPSSPSEIACLRRGQQKRQHGLLRRFAPRNDGAYRMDRRRAAGATAYSATWVRLEREPARPLTLTLRNPPRAPVSAKCGARYRTGVMTRFLIVDDHPLFREALQSAVRMAHPDAQVFEATSIDGAIDVAAAHRDLDLVLLDLSLPGTSGFSGLVRFRSAHPKLPVVVVSGHEDPDLVAEAMSLGIAGYIPKSTSRAELSDAIGEAINGSIYVPPAMRAKLADKPETEQSLILKKLRTLTPQQLLVLEMIKSGLQNKQIAFELKLAETTVKAHVSEILRKLGVYSRTRVVIEMAKVDFTALRGGEQAPRL